MPGVPARGLPNSTAVRARNVQTGAESVIPCAGFFVAIGHAPASELVKDQLPLHNGGYVEIEPGSDEHWINVGGPDFTDFQGNTWSSDAPFVNGGRTATSNTSIQYTELDPLYQSRRYGPADGSPLVFELPVPDMGPYRVRLYFVELDGFIRGQRIFDVTVEDAVRLEDLDVFRSAGPAKAHIRETYVNVDDGMLTVRLEPQLREAMISGIQVMKGTPTTSRPRLVTVGTVKKQ